MSGRPPALSSPMATNADVRAALLTAGDTQFWLHVASPPMDAAGTPAVITLPAASWVNQRFGASYDYTGLSGTASIGAESSSGCSRTSTRTTSATATTSRTRTCWPP